MRTIHFVWVISFLNLLSCNTAKEKSYPDADAVYLNLTKTYILNKDGSIVNSVEKKQKLFTYRSFQSLFGETRIFYNPDFQKLVIKESYTVNAQNQNIKTPDNGFNNVLPPFCQDSKAYSPLREMVVSHTGLERNAVINCSYNVTSAAGKIPFLMGIEELQADCPIEKLIIIVKVPAGKPIHYKLFNVSREPAVNRDNEFDSYTWEFNDIPQYNREKLTDSSCGDVPRLFFSTQENKITAINWLADHMTYKFSVNDDIQRYLDAAIRDKKTIAEKALKIQEIVVNELKTIYVPAPLAAFQVRPPEEVWYSNSGTVLEKACLLTSLLRSEGLDAETCLNIPECFEEKQLPFLLAGDPVVKITAGKEEVFLLAPDRLNTGNFDLGNDPSRILPLNITHPVLTNSKSTGRINISGKLAINPDGKLQGELEGQFSDSFNPYFEIIRNQGKCPQLLSDFTGTVGKVTAQQTNISFKAEKKDQLVNRGDFRFIDLIESKTGITSFHLGPMPFSRASSLYLGRSIDESYHYSFKVPVSWQLVNPVNIELLKPGIGHILIILKQSGSNIEVTREIGIFKPVIAKEDYPGFKELIDKWNTQKFRQLILK